MSDFELVRLEFDEVEASPGFAEWLEREQLCIAFSKGNSLCFAGRGEDGSLTVVDRQFGTCLALAAVGSTTLFLATRYQIWRLENGLPAGQRTEDGHDHLFLPQTAWTTGKLFVRDLAVTDDESVVFVNGLFSCLSIPSSRLSFEATWAPPFVSELAPEDRCGLSGLAMAAGKPAFVTSGSRSDEPAGWQAVQRDGGVVVAVETGDVVASGLSMPFSPVLRDGLVWLCLGGSGELATVDPADGAVTRVTELAGFARGLALHGDCAVVATSRAARNESFASLPLADRLSGADAEGRTGIYVVELSSGRVEHSLEFKGGSREVHALALLPGVGSAAAVPFMGDDVQELVTVPRIV